MIDGVKCFGKIKEYTTGIASIINCFMNFVNYAKNCMVCTVLSSETILIFK